VQVDLEIYYQPQHLFYCHSIGCVDDGRSKDQGVFMDILKFGLNIFLEFRELKSSIS